MNKTAEARPGVATKRSKRPAPERHQWLDPWLIAAEEPLHRLVEETTAFVIKAEKAEGARRRARRPDDEVMFRRSVDVVVSNLARAVLAPPPTGRLAVRLGAQAKGMSRYDNPALGIKPTRNLLNRLDSLEFLSLRSRAVRGEVSSIAPTEWFATKVREAAVSMAHFGRDGNEEIIVLTRNTRRFSQSGEPSTHRDRLNYRETSQTRRFREELRKLNRFLADADVTFIDDGLEPRVDPRECRMRRHFGVLPGQSERFDQNGRVFGGFWSTLKSGRRGNIRIDGEPVATLDYGSMFTRLAYARLGALPPDGDQYRVEGAKSYRSGIKMAMNTFLFDTSMKRGSWPKEMGVGVGDDVEAEDKASPAAHYEARLPPGWTVRRTREAILRRHPALAQAWGSGLGYSLMFTESRILLLVLNRLMSEGVPGLGLHDGLLVPQSKATLAKRTMEAAAREIAGADIPVEEKG